MEPLAAGDPPQIGTYRLRARLGAGGMGQVFLGYSPAGRAVAVKVIHRDLARDPAFRTRFRREVAAARAVSGAYTAPVTAAGPDDDPPWLATVFVPGPSLAEAVETTGPWPGASVWKLAAGLVEALQAVHACGLVHRDLKPANVLLAIDGPRVIDFGISRALESTAMTSTGQIVGTPSFMSPEQAEGVRVTPASDVFSLGGVIVFAVTGAGPFGNGPLASTLYRVVHAAPAIAEVPGGLRQLVAACLAKAPADRPALAALADMIAAGQAPGPDPGWASFWPVAVTGLIRSHQAGLSRQADLPGQAPDSPPDSGGPTTRRGPDAQPGPTTQHGPEVHRGPQARPTVLATAPAEIADNKIADGQPATATGHGGNQAAAMGLPADLLRGPAPVGGPVPGGHPEPGTTRRRVLLGLAVAAGVGLAGAGWELSQDSGQHRPPRAAAKSVRATPGKTAITPSGTTVWSFATGGFVGSGIAVADGVVYGGSNDDKAYALRASDGEKIWESRTGGAVQSDIVVARGAVYTGSADQNIYAFRASDGKKIWRFGISGQVSNGVAVAGGTVFSGGIGLTVCAVRASDGAKVWEFTAGDSLQGIAAGGGLVYAGSDNGNVYALRADNGDVVWQFATDGFVGPGIVVAGGIVYVGSYDERVYALHAGNGERIWEFKAGGPMLSGIAVAGGAVYAGSDDYRVYALRAGDGSKIWDFATGGTVESGIAVARGTVCFGSFDDKVYALHAGNGSKIWDFSTEGPVESGIVIAGDTVYVGSDDGNVYAVRL